MFKHAKPEFAGRVRNFQIFVINTESKFPHWKFMPRFLDEFLEWYKKSEGKIESVEFAVMVHFRFVSIHPFGDGNGSINRWG